MGLSGARRQTNGISFLYNCYPHICFLLTGFSALRVVVYLSVPLSFSTPNKLLNTTQPSHAA
jgi:hypothetical protein